MTSPIMTLATRQTNHARTTMLLTMFALPTTIILAMLVAILTR